MYFSENFSIKELYAGKHKFDATPPVLVPGRAFCSLSFRISGAIRVDGKTQTYHVTPNSIFYMPCGYDYTTTVVDNSETYQVHFWADAGYPGEPFVWKPKEPQVYGRLFSQLVDSYPLGCRQDLATMGLLYKLLAQIRADTESTQVILPKRMTQAREWIHGNYNDPDLSVAQLAQNANLSQTYFRREFKQSFGCQPITYIRNVRIEHAKALLEAGDCSVSEVAIRSGYENISYFSYDFHRMTGHSPSGYRTGAAKKENIEG